MDLSQVSFSKVTLNVQSPKDGGVSLNKGELLKGLVQEVSPEGLVMLVLKGKLIEAVTEVMVRPGQELYLMVDEFKNGKTYLKVVTPETMGRLEEANISANLKNIGIAVKDETIILARKLLQHNMPVTQSNMNELARGASQLGGANPRNLEIAAFAMSRGINGKTVLPALDQLLSPRGDLSQLIPLINRLINVLSENDVFPNVNPTSSQPAAETDNIAAKNSGNQSAVTGPPVDAKANQAPARVGLESLLARAVPSNSSAPPTPVERMTGNNNPTPDGSGSATNSVNTGSAAHDTVARTAAYNPPAFALSAQDEPQPAANGSNQKAPAAQPNNPGPENAPRQPAAGQTAPLPEQAKPAIITPPLEPLRTDKTITTAASLPASPEEAPPTANEAGAAQRSSMGNGPGAENGFLLINDDQPETASSANRTIIELLNSLKETMEMDPREAASRLAGKIKASNDLQPEILKALVLMEDILKDSEVQEKIPLLKDLATRLENLEKELTGQRIFNLAPRAAGESFAGYYYFSFPVKMEQGYSLCQVRVNRDSRRKLRDVDSMSVVVSLNTARLGTVLFHVEWRRSGELILQGRVENQSSCDFLNKNIGELVDGLKNLGYRVINQGIKVSTPQELELRPALEEAPEKVRPFGIDVKV